MTITNEAMVKGLKTCKVCNHTKSIDDFYDSPTTADRKFLECKACVSEQRKAAYQEKNKKLPEAQVKKLTRSERLVKGYLEPSELSDTELTERFIMEDDGTRTPFNQLPPGSGKRWSTKLNAELSLRISEYIKSKAPRAVQVIFEIADSELVEPSDRLKASQWLAERVIGKTPEVLLTGDAGKPYESIFDTKIESGPREDYRQALDVDFVEDDGSDSGSDQRDGVHSDSGRHSRISSETINKEINSKDSAHFDALVAETSIDRSDSDERDSLPIRQLGELSSGSTHDDSGDENRTLELVEQKVETKSRAEEIRKARQKAKQRRFAARAVGATSLESLPFSLEYTLIKTGPMVGKLRLRLIHPEVLSEVKVARLAEVNALTDMALGLLYPDEQVTAAGNDGSVGENHG